MGYASEMSSDEASSAQADSNAVVDQTFILSAPTPARQPRMRMSQSSHNVGSFDGQWRNFDAHDGVADAACPSMSYREYLQSRGSEVLQLTCCPKRTNDKCSPRSASPSVPEALWQPSAPSTAAPHISGWNVPADNSCWPKNTHKSHCSKHALPLSLDCSQHGHMEPLVHLDHAQIMSDTPQMPPSINHSVSHQLLYSNNQQCSLQVGCPPACFIGHNAPIISNFTQQTLERAVTMPNLWSMCDGSPHSLDGTTVARSDKDLMVIAMPDALSLSNSEIVAQLQSAAPCVYED